RRGRLRGEGRGTQPRAARARPDVEADRAFPALGRLPGLQKPAKPWTRPLGAVLREEGLVEFRVWAPAAAAIAVRVRGVDHELAGAGDGLFEGDAPAEADDDYEFVLDGAAALPDPCSRFQPRGIRGPSRVVDPGAFSWTDGSWEGVPLVELVLYELHVGTFSEEETFD